MYLLDTHVLIWAEGVPSKLGKHTARLIERASHIFFSAVSFAELSIKRAKGKIDYSVDFEEKLVRRGFGELPFKVLHASEISRFGTLKSHEPIDRMLLAQAAAEDFTFITADETLLALNFPWILDARL